MEKIFSSRTALLCLFLVAAAVSRLLPHPPNFAPITAMALFGAAYFSRWWMALLFPVAAMFISDTLLELATGWGYHSGMAGVYASFVAVALLGRFAKGRVSAPLLGGLTLAGTSVFFVLSNFFVWASGTMYPMTMEGLTACYVAAIPFFGNALNGDIVFAALLFGGFEYAQYRFPQVAEAQAAEITSA